MVLPFLIHKKILQKKFAPTALPHARDSVLGPEHPAPQALPAIQDRDRVCVPCPQPTEHLPQAPYGPHRELTEIKRTSNSIQESSAEVRGLYIKTNSPFETFQDPRKSFLGH